MSGDQNVVSTEGAKSIVQEAARAAQAVVQEAVRSAQAVVQDAARSAQAVVQSAQAVHDLRLSFLERAVADVADTLKKLVTLDTILNTIRIDVDDHEKRVRVIEAELPVLKLIRNWVIAGVLGVWGIGGTAAAAFLFSRFGS